MCCTRLIVRVGWVSGERRKVRGILQENICADESLRDTPTPTQVAGSCAVI